MSLFALPNPTPPPPSESIARSLLAHANRTLEDRVAEHRNRFHEFWDSPATPAEIAAAMGAKGAIYLAAASESVRHIATLATIAGISLHDVLPPEHYEPRLPLLADPETGFVSVGTVEGLDAWGRAPEEPEQPPI